MAKPSKLRLPEHMSNSTRILTLILLLLLTIISLYGGVHVRRLVTSIAPYATRGILPAPSESDNSNCLQFINYNKPVKTGSTSVTMAIRAYLHTFRNNDLGCGPRQCAPYAERLCRGEEPVRHSIGHLHVNLSLLSCVRDQGYYMVTSIRDPYTRWMSTYLFNRERKGNHYNIPWNITFAEYVKVFPPCALFYYYERVRKPCYLNATDEEIDARVEAITGMFDDVIELGAEPVSDLHKRIAPFVGHSYVSDKKEGVPDSTLIDPYVLRHETRLYEALKKKKYQAPAPGRSLCKTFPHDPKFRPQNGFKEMEY